ncbi:lipoyl(octanoyl) transferase LipB [Sulfuriflexus sp.]|uniref:lipoyl(octanoyl) transferase LipB n=1 Tax=Sulfuriflexus sp. TaxID=2015443 RepID=UPI0028CDE650|nr:lipoyl(octanoyl) transferase LipB [Sulfuriflexus sp.]MDT8403321.1 lipoyl(octanoyl) transferase LipB [Sulfuriflexus sp.]
MPRPAAIIVRNLGTQDYLPVYAAMCRVTAGRDAHSADEFWLVEHPSVFTQGRNSDPAHLLAPGDIPVVDIDRGGQVTYHGPGQILLYTLIDLPRAGFGVRDLVSALERSVIALLAEHHIEAAARPDAPGVYVDGAKIAALGLRVKRGRSYHGLSLNVDMALEPFSRINPCGYKGMEVTMLRELGVQASQSALAARLCDLLAADLGYNARQFCEESPL